MNDRDSRGARRASNLATIRLNKVSKQFGLHSRPGQGVGIPRLRADENDGPRRVLALDQVDLTVPDGQTMAVLGPSGCGKSTLLRVIAGLEPDYHGDLYYDDQEMADVAAKDRYIGMVFQNYALYPHFEGRGNLSFFFRMHKAPDEEAEERIRITSEIMGIGFKALLQRKPGTLSGGQQQRVAIARAIVRRPRVFLFDEPLSNLDAKLRSQTRVEIKRLLHRFAITALYVTHDQTEAMAIGDQAAVMREGKIEQVGTFAEVRQNPANTFVAGFLGVPPMNLVHKVELRDGFLDAGQGLAFRPPASQLDDLAAGDFLTVGFRPESVQVTLTEDETDAPAAESEAAQTGTWTGTVETVEPDYGRHIQLIHFESAGRILVGQADVRARIAQGERIRAQLDESDLHLFDGNSGKRVA